LLDNRPETGWFKIHPTQIVGYIQQHWKTSVFLQNTVSQRNQGCFLSMVYVGIENTGRT
jgi:hypothetical protein